MLSRSLIPLLAIGLLLGCESGTRLSPSPEGPIDATTALEVGRQWSPYVGVHATLYAMDAYRDALRSLQRAGHVRGVRVEILRHEPTNPVIKAIGAMGIELLALISNEFLFEPNIEREIDRIFSAYPEVRHFQIGNEVTTILPPTGPTIVRGVHCECHARRYRPEGAIPTSHCD
jgi:hypothetical protein